MARSSAASGVPASMSPDAGTGCGWTEPEDETRGNVQRCQLAVCRRGTHASLTVPCGDSMGSLESTPLMWACASRSASASRMAPSASSSHMTAVVVGSPVSAPGSRVAIGVSPLRAAFSVLQRHVPPLAPSRRTLRRWRVVSKARNAVSAGPVAGRLGGSEGVHSQACTKCAESAFFAAGDGLVPLEAMAGKRASPLGLRGARLPRSGAVGSPLALRAAASPQHSIYRIPARLRLPRDESRVGGQGSRGERGNPPSPTAYPQVLNRVSRTPGRYEARSKSRKSCRYLRKLDQLLGRNPSQTTQSALETLERCFPQLRKAALSVNGTSEQVGVICDSHPMWLDAVEHVLRRIAIRVVGKTTSMSEALSLVEQHRPDLLITEVEGMNGDLSGLALIERSRAAVPSVRPIVLSMHQESHVIDAALVAGASAYVVKTAHPEDLASAVRQAFSHSVYLADGRTLAPAPVEASRGSGGRAGPDAARARDPSARGRGAFERPARPDALGDRADGQVPPVEHLQEARRREPHRGEPMGPAPRPARRTRGERVRTDAAHGDGVVVSLGVGDDEASAAVWALVLVVSVRAVVLRELDPAPAGGAGDEDEGRTRRRCGGVRSCGCRLAMTGGYVRPAVTSRVPRPGTPANGFRPYRVRSGQAQRRPAKTPPPRRRGALQ